MKIDDIWEKVFMIFDYIKAAQFFPKYCPDIINWKHKLRGKNGRGNPVEFTDQENRKIKSGLKKLFKDLN